MVLRKAVPARTGDQTSGDYRKHKEQLREDFNKCCGYCDGYDHYSGGWRGYQIDHFAPHSKFPDLKEVYANLVYSCAFCNRSKSNKWIGEDADKPNNGTEGFVDPCEESYSDHLTRRDDGGIIAVTALGEYIHRELNLGLLRHQLLWQAEELASLKNRVIDLLPKAKASGHNEARIALLEMFLEITCEYEGLRATVVEA